MARWLNAVRGAVLTGLAWAAVWAGVGVILGTVWDPASSLDRLWVPVGAPPGFLSGLLFFAGIRWVEGQGGPWETRASLPFAATGGAIIGACVGALPFGIGTPTTDLPLWLLAAENIGPMAILGALSALGSVWVARAWRVAGAEGSPGGDRDRRPG
jgi:hypothetical protein